MKLLLVILLLLPALSCASRKNKQYPENGVVGYIDLSAGSSDGSLDVSGVEMHYRGSFKDNIEDIEVIEASASNTEGSATKAALRELQAKALKLNADGIHDVQVKEEGKKSEVSGIAFRFKR